MPKVSVVIPTFNRALLVQRAVRTVLAQTYTDIEVLVVDDGSTDDTCAVLRSLVEEDSRLRYLRHEINRGAQATRNVGCRAVSSEYVAFLDSDNEWLPDKLRLQMEIFERSGDQLGVVYCGFRVLYPDQSYFDMWPRHRGDVYRAALRRWLTDTSTLVVRRDILEKVDYWDERIRTYQEWDMCIRLARVAKFEFVPELLVLYYRHPSQRISNDRFLNALGHLDVIEAHRQEIQRVCGSKVLGEHYFRTGQQFVEANRFDWASRTLLRCLRTNPLHLSAFRLLISSCFLAAAIRRLLRPSGADGLAGRG